MKKSVTLRGPHVAPKHGSPNAFGSKTASPGTVLGTTKSGKQVFSHGQVNAYHGFSSADHTEAGMMHAKAAESTIGNPKLADHHNQKMKLHNQAAITATKREGRFKAGMKAKVEAAKNYKPIMVKSDSLEKAMKIGDDDKWRNKKFPHPSGHTHFQVKVEAPSKGSPGNRYHVYDTDSKGKDNWHSDFGSLKEAHQHINEKLKKPCPCDTCEVQNDSVKKSLSAGGMGGAPSTMVNGAAYQKENLKKDEVTKKPISEMHPDELVTGKMYDIGLKSGHYAKYHCSTPAAHRFSSENETKHHKVPRVKSLEKSDLTKRAEEEYQNWSKREEFEKFMKSKMPHLADGEIKAIGHVVALQKSWDAEKLLAKFGKK
jgi:hypothetical protein